MVGLALGGFLVGAAWAITSFSGGSSTPSPVAPFRTAIRVPTENDFGDTLPNGIKIIGTADDVRLANSNPRTWLSLDIAGLPTGALIGDMDTVTVGICAASGQRRVVDRSTAVVTSYSDYRTFKGHLRLSFPNLPLAANNRTAWITVTRVSARGNVYYGGTQGSLLHAQQRILSRHERPCSPGT